MDEPDLVFRTMSYQFECEGERALKRELAALAGDWYAQMPWLVDDETGEVFTTGFSFLLPDYAGVASWRARTLSAAQAGDLRFQPPKTNNVTLGKPLGRTLGPFSGFRPMQLTNQRTPDHPEWTILYAREAGPSVDGESEPNRGRLRVAYCPSIQSSEVEGPAIEDCARDDYGTWRQIYEYGRAPPR